jgi:hypothetical protein
VKVSLYESSARTSFESIDLDGDIVSNRADSTSRNNVCNMLIDITESDLHC